MPSELFGNPAGDLVVRRLFNVRSQLWLVDVLRGVDQRPRLRCWRGGACPGSVPCSRRRSKRDTALFLLGLKIVMALPRVNSKSCLTAERGRSSRCQFTGHDMPLVGVFLMCAVLVRAGHPAKCDLLGRL